MQGKSTLWLFNDSQGNCTGREKDTMNAQRDMTLYYCKNMKVVFIYEYESKGVRLQRLGSDFFDLRLLTVFFECLKSGWQPFGSFLGEKSDKI